MGNYTVIDFELANRHPSSICAIGLCYVKNNKIVKTYYSHVRPVPFLMERGNYNIHKIHMDQLKNAPTFDQVWNEVQMYFENTTIIAHNIQQDSFYLREVLDYYGIAYPDCKMSCSFVLSKKLLHDCTSFKLDGLASYFGFQFKHHHALEDALMCTRIIKSLLYLYHCKDIDDLHRLTKVNYGRMKPGYYCNLYMSDITNNHENTCLLTEITNPALYQKCFCFDSIHSSSLLKYQNKIIHAGGFVQNNVNLNTTYLVVDKHHISKNYKKARLLQKKGQDLKIISYTNLKKMINHH